MLRTLAALLVAPLVVLCVVMLTYSVGVVVTGLRSVPVAFSAVSLAIIGGSLGGIAVLAVALMLGEPAVAAVAAAVVLAAQVAAKGAGRWLRRQFPDAEVVHVRVLGGQRPPKGERFY